jgi:hypothetical protein
VHLAKVPESALWSFGVSLWGAVPRCFCSSAIVWKRTDSEAIFALQGMLLETYVVGTAGKEEDRYGANK